MRSGIEVVPPRLPLQLSINEHKVTAIHEKNISLGVFLFLALLVALQPAYAADLSLPKDTPVKVYFSPKGGCTEAIISEIDQAKTEILIQAYSFTSAPIAKTLVSAYKKGVKVQAILDKSQRSE